MVMDTENNNIAGVELRSRSVPVTPISFCAAERHWPYEHVPNFKSQCGEIEVRNFFTQIQNDQNTTFKIKNNYNLVNGFSRCDLL